MNSGGRVRPNLASTRAQITSRAGSSSSRVPPQSKITALADAGFTAGFASGIGVHWDRHHPVLEVSENPDWSHFHGLNRLVPQIMERHSERVVKSARHAKCRGARKARVDFKDRWVAFAVHSQ